MEWREYQLLHGLEAVAHAASMKVRLCTRGWIPPSVSKLSERHTRMIASDPWVIVTKHNPPLRAWFMVCKPKDMGGLGVVDLQDSKYRMIALS
jgi:hypothetical protein